MKQWRIDFTLERFGDMVIKASTAEEAKEIFKKRALEKITFVNGHTYDWDVRVNYTTEEENKPPFDFYQPKVISAESARVTEKNTKSLLSPLYSEINEDPLVSYISQTKQEEVYNLPWND